MTPNLQRLADRGVTFMNAYCAAPACNPSRAALMTGIRPHVTGLTTNAGGVFFREFEYQGRRPLENAVTMPQWLQQHDWYTAETGKIFHSGGSFKAADGNRSWTAWTDVPGNAGGKRRGRFSPKSLDWGQEGDDDATYPALNDYRKADFIARMLSDGKATETRIDSLDDKARVDEIARMLGGIDITVQTRRHAREMIERAQKVAS